MSEPLAPDTAASAPPASPEAGAAGAAGGAARPSSAARTWLGEPLLHFVLLGTLVFGLEAWLAPERQDPTLLLDLSPAREQELVETWTQKAGKPPQPAERQRMLAQWVDREMLYRTGLELGLDRDDTLIRDQVIRNTAFLYNRTAPVPEPTEAQLQSYLEEHRERYVEPERWDLEHAFVSRQSADAPAQAERLLAELEAGKTVQEVGERFPKGNVLRRRTADSLAVVFDEPFAQHVFGLPLRQWRKLESRWGWHVVRVTGHYPERQPELEALRERLRQNWERDQRHAHVRERLDALRRRYRVRLPDGSVHPAREIISDLAPDYAQEEP